MIRVVFFNGIYEKGAIYHVISKIKMFIIIVFHHQEFETTYNLSIPLEIF